MKPGRSAAVEKPARRTDLFNEGTAAWGMPKSRRIVA
jgi:hypothetical protein